MKISTPGDFNAGEVSMPGDFNAGRFHHQEISKIQRHQRLENYSFSCWEVFLRV